MMSARVQARWIQGLRVTRSQCSHDARWGGDFLTQMDVQLVGVERVGSHALLELPCIQTQLPTLFESCQAEAGLSAATEHDQARAMCRCLVVSSQHFSLQLVWAWRRRVACESVTLGPARQHPLSLVVSK